MDALQDANEARKIIVAYEDAMLSIIAQVEQREKIEAQKRKAYQC